MKKFLALALLFSVALAIEASATGRVDEKNWSAMQTYDVRALEPAMESHTRDFVAVKFTFRGKDIYHMKPNWFEGSIWRQNPENKKGFSHIRVMISKQDINAFKALTTDSAATQEVTAYGRVLRDFDSNYMFVQVLGVKATPDPKGGMVVGW